MQNPTEKGTVALIAGPTAGGKSALALAIARERPVTIINADASQVYAALRILTARPADAELAAAPHLLYGCADASDPWSAARWAAAARHAIGQSLRAGRLPILVGGTGLYLRALLDGLAPVPPIDPAVRADVRRLPQAEAYDALAREDGAAAARLNRGDRARTARALEVVRSTGRSLLDWQAERVGGIGREIDLRAMVIAPPRAILYERCDRRLDHMLAAGALDEVAALLGRGLDPGLPIMKALGVQPLVAHLRGEASLEAARAKAQQQTRAYAKRQLTWFRGQCGGWPQLWQEDCRNLTSLVMKLLDAA